MKSGECSGMSDLIGLFFSASLSARQGRKLQRVARQRVTMLQREAGLRQWQTWVATRHHTQFHTLRSVNWSCVTTRPYKNTSKFYVLTQLKEETWQLDNLYFCVKGNMYVFQPSTQLLKSNTKLVVHPISGTKKSLLFMSVSCDQTFDFYHQTQSIFNGPKVELNISLFLIFS